MKELSIVCLIIAINSVAIVSAQEEVGLVGDRPDLTESAVTVGNMRLQIETGFGWERFSDDDFEANNYFNPTLFRFGLGDQFELRLETASFSKFTTKLNGAETDSGTGFSPISLGAKINFFEADQIGELTLGALFNVEVPSGTDEFETEDPAYALKLLGAMDFNETISLGFNLGIHNDMDFLGERFTHFTGTASLAMALTDKFGAFVELAADTEEYSEGEAQILFDAGVTYLLQDNLQLDLAAGTGLKGELDPDFFMTTGLIVLF